MKDGSLPNDFNEDKDAIMFKSLKKKIATGEEGVSPGRQTPLRARAGEVKRILLLFKAAFVSSLQGEGKKAMLSDNNPRRS